MKPNDMDDDDIGEMYREWREAKREKRARNRDFSKNLLVSKGIRIVEYSGGVHLVVHHVDGLRVYDFWPGTGLWKLRGSTTQRGRGVYHLLNHYNTKFGVGAKKGRN